MDENENMSEEERVDCPLASERKDCAKRMRTDFDQEESSTSSNNSEHNSNSTDCQEQSASTSSDSGLPVSVGEENHNTIDIESPVEENKSPEHGAERMSEERGSDDDDEDLDSVLSSLGDYNSRRSTSSENTIIHSTDTESDEEAHVEEVMKKEKPKHTWYMVPELVNRQVGYSTSKSNPSLFQQRCYGSLRNVQKLELMYKLEDHDGCVNSLNFSPDGTLLASGSDDLKVVIWDWRIGKSITKVETRHRRNVFQTKFLDLKGPDLHLATCARDGQVWYSQICQEGLRHSRKLGQHRGPCHKLAALKDQPHVVLSAGEDGIVFNHDVRKTRPDRIVHVKDDEREVALYSIHPHPLNTHQFCVAGRESSVRVYDQRKCSRPLAKYCPYKENDGKYYSHRLHITCAVYNHDGSEILASYNDDDVYIFDVDRAPGQYAHRYSGHRNGATIKGVSFFGSRSEFVMSGSDCGHVFFWERKTESIVQFLLADDNGVVNCLEPHPQLPFLATSGLDWDVKIWVPSCEEEPTLSGLAQTIKENKRSGWANHPDSSESQSLPQVLWMLWRRLRASRAARNDPDGTAGGAFAGFSPLSVESSGSDTSSESLRSRNDDDLDDDAPGCTTS